MNAPRLAIFPGSFDPLTVGHVDLIRRAAHLFDRLVVAVLINPHKQSLFSVEERLAHIRAVAAELPEADRIEADAFEGLLVHYAQRRDACAVVRGLRNSADFDYEQPMAAMNAHLAPSIDTVCLVGAGRLAHISSRLVKEVASLGGSIDGLVPASVAEPLMARLGQKRRT